MVIAVKKAVLFLIMVTFLMIGACGCGMRTIKNEKSNVVPYLQDKYAEEFTLETYEMRSIDIPYDEAVCVNANGQKVKVYIDYEDNGVVMTDNYYGTLKMPQYREALQAVVEKYAAEYKLFTQFSANYFDSACNHEMPLCQAMTEKTAQFYTRTFLFIPETVQMDEKAFLQLRENLLQKNMTMYLAVYQIPQDVYATIDEKQKASIYITGENEVEPLYKEVIQ